MSPLGFAAEADVIVEVENLEPGTQVFSSFAPGLGDQLAGELAAVVDVRYPGFLKRGPLSNLPITAFVRGVGSDPCQDLTVAQSFCYLRFESIRIDAGEADRVGSWFFLVMTIVDPFSITP